MHTLSGEREADGDGGQQSFWHVGDDDTDHEHQVSDKLRLHYETHREEDDAEGDGDGRNNLMVLAMQPGWECIRGRGTTGKGVSNIGINLM